MGGPASPKNPFSKSDPEPLDFNKPELRLEHIDSIAELSQIYLKADTVEFSEEELVSNLPKLWSLSLSSKMTPQHTKKLASIMSFVAGPPQDKEIAALREKISAFGGKNKMLEKKALELEKSIAGMEKAKFALSGANKTLKNELLAMKGSIATLRATSEKHQRRSRAVQGESAAKHRLALAILKEAHDMNKRLNARVGKLESELQDYEQAIKSASELLGHAKKK